MPMNPYDKLSPEAFWSSGVAQASPFSLPCIYRKKWPIESDSTIATAGSCFAQHIARHMRGSGFKVLDMEPPPLRLAAESHQKFGFSMYSCRYGNIYTTRQLLQLANEAAGKFEPAESVWEKDGRFFDAQRPAVEPEGLASPQEVREHRQHHLKRVRAMFEEMSLFIFTLGLTEAWVHKASGTVYPTAPGTIAGNFDPDTYAFKNFSYAEVLEAFQEFERVVIHLRGGRPFSMLVTVSPVPLTATASGTHVLQATAYSKAVLRAVAGQLSAQPNIDYFPSYEIVTNQAARGLFYDTNMRSVRPEGVATVMKVFFAEHGAESPEAGDPAGLRQGPEPEGAVEQDVQCEEAMLEAFRQ